MKVLPTTEVKRFSRKEKKRHSEFWEHNRIKKELEVPVGAYNLPQSGSRACRPFLETSPSWRYDGEARDGDVGSACIMCRLESYLVLPRIFYLESLPPVA
nr:unnamed protein product [Callosobruchus analis]